ncbi:MAG TPA: hypothetical protein VHC69_15050 [Polyangiaceae bacterium]|nr:hypothetical protein [Polyangiaceae bacterium]
MKATELCAGTVAVFCAALLLGCSSDGGGAGTEEVGGAGGVDPLGVGSTTSFGNQKNAGGSAGSGNSSGQSSGGTATAGSGGAGANGGKRANGGTSSSSGGASAGGGGSTTSPGKPGTVGGCTIFTADDAWNKDISASPVDATWTAHVQAAITSGLHLHPDYGNSGSDHFGMPINVVPQSQPAVPVSFDDYADESDPGPYPFPDPSSARLEGGTPTSCDGDCHFLTIQSGTCMLYEGYACQYSNGWHCSNGAKWDLTKNSYGQRPKGWTSADAAGLAVTPGLVRYDEVRAGAVTHAIRFTMKCTRANFVAPATHDAVPPKCDPNDPNSPPMGLRVRLNKTKFDISTLSASAQVVAKAMQTYGLILADNGSDFYFQGEDNPGWTDQDVEPLKTIPAAAFEAIVPPALEN